MCNSSSIDFDLFLLKSYLPNLLLIYCSSTTYMFKTMRDPSLKISLGNNNDHVNDKTACNGHIENVTDYI